MVSESDGEVEACVELQKPGVLSNEASYTIFTQDGTAIGMHTQSIKVVRFMFKTCRYL